MWQKFRKREEARKVYYKDKGEPACDHLPRTAVDGVISWEPVSMHWNIKLSLHLETMPCKGRNAAARTLLSHPTPPHLETMPCWVWPQVCQRKERSWQDVIIPPHPTPPHPTASRDDAMLSVATSVSKEGTQLAGRYYPTPPHPTPPPRIWTRCYVDCGRKCDADVGFWVARMVVAESPFFGCEILFFWLRNRFILLAEAPFLGCGSVSDFRCGIAEIWLRKRRNIVSESEFIPCNNMCWFNHHFALS